MYRNLSGDAAVFAVFPVMRMSDDVNAQELGNNFTLMSHTSYIVSSAPIATHQDSLDSLLVLFTYDAVRV